MDLTNIKATVWNILNYPIMSFGNNTITPWAILLNSFILILFVFISSRIRNWLLSSLSRKKGMNVGNWRVAITLGYYVFIVLGIMGILQTSGLDLSFFTVLTGAIGIGVGFGMQTIFSNFISGIIILLEKPIRLGDRIEVGEVSGNVHDISVRATTIITNDNVAIIVPNSDFISKQVINWSSSGNTVRLRINVSVAYDSDPDFVEKILLDVADKEPGVLKSPVPKVRLTEFGESGLHFSLMIWTQEYIDFQGSLKSLLNFNVLKSFRAAGIHIPYPQREVRVLNHSLTEKETL